MSGTYSQVNAEPGVPGGLLESAQAVRDGLAQAVSAYQVTQVEAASFMNAHAAAVRPGHGDVGHPGRMGDPDMSGDASDD